MMIRLLITSRFIGADDDLIIEFDDRGGTCTSWVDRGSAQPSDTWILDEQASSDIDSNLFDVNALMMLAGRQVMFPDAATMQMCTELGLDDSSRVWMQVMPRWKVMKMLREIARDFVNVLAGPDGVYYRNVYEPTRRLVRSLACAHIDETLRAKYMTMGGGNIPALESFAPDADGFARQPSYDILTGRTGRAKISSGPQILTLAKTHRDIIKTRWRGGRVVMLDFMSLEARIAAITAGRSPPDDLYSALTRDVLLGMTREQAKLTTLTAIYGGGSKLLQSQGLAGDDASVALAAIRDYFAVDAIVEQLTRELAETGALRSVAGRRVACPNSAAHILYNSYVQASGVDVALSGFNNIASELTRRRMQSKIVYILQDACIIDMHPDELLYTADLCDVGSHVAYYSSHFPLRCKELTA